jgi:hypothetical protein
MSLRKFAGNNGLSLVIFGIFFLTIVGMSIVGWRTENNTRQEHAQPSQSYGKYVTSGDFAESVFENWESEFLQMWALVILTVVLRQKGSKDSKPLRGQAEEDTSSRYSIIRALTWKKRSKALGHMIYSHSLGLALLSLFVLSFIFHAIGGAEAYNQEALAHGSQTVSTLSYITTAQFWFESLQNWQSEFLAVGILLVLSIKLRERGSQQSKPVGKTFDHTTGG